MRPTVVYMLFTEMSLCCSRLLSLRWANKSRFCLEQFELHFFYLQLMGKMDWSVPMSLSIRAGRDGGVGDCPTEAWGECDDWKSANNNHALSGKAHLRHCLQPCLQYTVHGPWVVHMFLTLEGYLEHMMRRMFLGSVRLWPLYRLTWQPLDCGMLKMTLYCHFRHI